VFAHISLEGKYTNLNVHGFEAPHLP